jgi:rhodanese-related sulfurtransferase
MNTITTSELEELKQSNKEFVLIDVMDSDYYEEQHIPGAINIIYEDIAEKALDRFNKDQTIVLYCKNEMCTASPKAAEKLEKLGFEDVRDYENGLAAWKEAGNKVES